MCRRQGATSRYGLRGGQKFTRGWSRSCEYWAKLSSSQGSRYWLLPTSPYHHWWATSWVITSAAGIEKTSSGYSMPMPAPSPPRTSTTSSSVES